MMRKVPTNAMMANQQRSNCAHLLLVWEARPLDLSDAIMLIARSWGVEKADKKVVVLATQVGTIK